MSLHAPVWVLWNSPGIRLTPPHKFPKLWPIRRKSRIRKTSVKFAYRSRAQNGVAPLLCLDINPRKRVRTSLYPRSSTEQSTHYASTARSLAYKNRYEFLRTHLWFVFTCNISIHSSQWDGIRRSDFIKSVIVTLWTHDKCEGGRMLSIIMLLIFVFSTLLHNVLPS